MSLFGKKSDASSAEKEVAHPDLGRNDPCHCGSGKKYKKCCMAKDEASERKILNEKWAKATAEAKDQAEKKSKDTKENPTVKHAGAPRTTKQQHPTYVPHQVSMPRKSGGG